MQGFMNGHLERIPAVSNDVAQVNGNQRPVNPGQVRSFRGYVFATQNDTTPPDRTFTWEEW